MVILAREENWISARVDEELVMMSVQNDVYVGLSEVGTRIWELIETPQDIEAICKRLVSEYEVDPQTCREEVERFVNDLVRHGAARLDAN